MEGDLVSVCRCEEIDNKPFCDGSKLAAGFATDSEARQGTQSLHISQCLRGHPAFGNLRTRNRTTTSLLCVPHDQIAQGYLAESVALAVDHHGT